MESPKEMCHRCLTLKNTNAGHRTLTVQALVGHCALKEIAKFQTMSLYTCETCGTNWSFDPALGWRELKEADLRRSLMAG